MYDEKEHVENMHLVSAYKSLAVAYYTNGNKALVRLLNDCQDALVRKMRGSYIEEEKPK